MIPEDRRAACASELSRTADLLEEARSGDAAARDALFARYREPLSRFLHARLPASARGMLETEDVVPLKRLEEFPLGVRLYEGPSQGSGRASRLGRKANDDPIRLNAPQPGENASWQGETSMSCRAPRAGALRSPQTAGRGQSTARKPRRQRPRGRSLAGTSVSSSFTAATVRSASATRTGKTRAGPRASSRDGDSRAGTEAKTAAATRSDRRRNALGRRAGNWALDRGRRAHLAAQIRTWLFSEAV